MGVVDSGTPDRRIALSGLAQATVAVVMFSGTVVATRLAVRTIDPIVVGVGRSVVGAILAAVFLVITRAPRPRRDQVSGIVVVSIGAAIGFGGLSALAMRTVTAVHGSIVIGLLPMVTAIISVLRTGTRPRPLFWLAGMTGTAAVVWYVMATGPSGGLGIGDALLMAALLMAAAAYTEGGRLAQSMPGGQVIAWGLVCALPVSLPLTALALHGAPFRPSLPSLAALGYMAFFSVFVGMVLWYRGMGLAGVARVSQVQLLQPLLSVFLSGLLIGERLRPEALVAALVVLLCVGASQRARVGTASAPHPNRTDRHRLLLGADSRGTSTPEHPTT